MPVATRSLYKNSKNQAEVVPWEFIMASTNKSAAAPSDSNASTTDWYQPLNSELLQLQCESFQQLKAQIDQEWEEETAKYEQLITIETIPQDGKTITMEPIRPRRNYANPQGIVEDPSMYPYDTALYPLLDAYDALYVDKIGHSITSLLKHPIPFDSIPPCLLPFDKRIYAGSVDDNNYEDPSDVPVVDSHTPVSIQALAQTMLQKQCHCCSYETLVYMMQHALDDNQSYLASPLVDLKAQAALQGDNAFYAAAAQKELFEQNDTLLIDERHGHDRLPFERTHRGSILLKLLKHSLSELQRDDRLAAAVLVLLARHHDLDDCSLLARLLTIVSSEYIACDRECEWTSDSPATHYCMERELIIDFLPQVLAFGVTVFKEEHVNVLAGFVRSTFHREFGHLLDEENETADLEGKWKLRMKRTACVRRLENEDDDAEGSTKVPVDLVNNVIQALGVRGSLERHRLKAVRSGDTNTQAVSLALETYVNCLRALVDIAEACLLYLPVIDQYYTLASAVVKNIASLLINSTAPLIKPVDESQADVGEDSNSLYFGVKDAALAETRMCVPNRMANCITDASNLLQKLEQPRAPDGGSAHEMLFGKIQQICHGRPPTDVRDAVRALFLRNMVDIRAACLGYTDFLLWCRFTYDVTPLDPVVCAYGTNFPCEEDDSDDSDSDDDDDSDDDSSASGEDCVMHWCADEDEHELTRGELRARHDLSLLLLFRAWSAPWNPSSHLSFQPEFRQAAKCVMLSTHRLAMPRDVGLRIVEFLGRDFWPDDRVQCWRFECAEVTIFTRVAGDRRATTSIRSAAVRCPGCRIASYCCTSCMKDDYKDDHKRFCGVPPFRPITASEEGLVAKILDGDANIFPIEDATDDPMVVDNAGFQEGSDDDEWSDIGSNAEEEAESTLTRTIYRFFEEKTYTPRGVFD
ncbi:hypothetical protein MPSEU_000355000 [Mayamaea pseudoterrestris]|nr:hypothetical protein MPSEU_000355000 [Mayamaea pseudoterrestris]